MAALTFTQIKTRTRRFVGDVNTTAAHQRFSDTIVEDTINGVMDEFASEALVQKGTATGTVVTGDNEYTFPTDSYKVYRITLGTDERLIFALSNVDLDQWKHTWRQDGNNTPVYWYPTTSRKWKLYPPAASSFSGQTINYFYYDMPAVMTSDTESPDFASEFHKALIHGSAGELLQMDRRLDESIPHLGKFSAFVQKARARMRAAEDRAKRYEMTIDRGEVASLNGDPLENEFIKRF